MHRIDSTGLYGWWHVSELPFLAGEQGRGSFLVLLFFVSAAAVSGWGIWEGALPHSEEAVYAEMARETAETGSIRTVRFDGERVFGAPPLPLWVTALGIRLFGTNVFAARLCFVLFAVLSYWVVYLTGMQTELWQRESTERMRCGSAIGLLAAIILASSPLFAKFAPHITPAVPFACFAVMSLLGWWYLPVRRIGLVLWGIGIVGGLLSAGSAGLLVIPAGLVSITVDRRRRVLWRSAAFIVVTVAALILGGYWPARAAMIDPGGFRSNPLWSAVFGFSNLSGSVVLDVLRALRDLFLRNLPWSIPAALAVVRTIFMRRSLHRFGDPTADDTLVVFSAVLFVPIVFSRPSDLSAYLPLLPLAAVLSAREVSRWLMPPRRESTAGKGTGAIDPDRIEEAHGGDGVRRSDVRGFDSRRSDARDSNSRSSDAREFTISRIWSLNQILVALFCLLMLLLAATPLRLHRTTTDPIKAVAVMAGSLVPEGERLGNYRQNYRVQTARLLFYGGRPLGPMLTNPAEAAAAFREDPDRVFLAADRDMRELEESGAVLGGLRILYRAGDLVLFGLKR